MKLFNVKETKGKAGNRVQKKSNGDVAESKCRTAEI